MWRHSTRLGTTDFRDKGKADDFELSGSHIGAIHRGVDELKTRPGTTDFGGPVRRLQKLETRGARVEFHEVVSMIVAENKHQVSGG